MTSPRRALLRWVARHHGAPAALLLGPAALWLVAFFLLPVLILLAYSVMPRGAYGGVQPGFTLEHYQRFFDPLYLGILRRTIWLSFLCTIACLVLAYPTAFVIARSGRWRNLLLFLAVLPFWTSSICFSYK